MPYFSDNSTSVDVWGGDCLTQKTWFRQRSVADYAVRQGGASFTVSGFGGGMAFYSQNRVNTQMTNKATGESGISYQYPFIAEEPWLNQIENVGLTLKYSHGYDIANKVNADNAFDPNLKRSNKQPVRIWWSDLKPQNAVADNYTNFPPLNFKDLQLAFGHIEHHLNVNSQLMTWQPNHFEFQYFDSTGLLVTNAQEAVLGNASVMSQRGTALSTYGTKHGFSVIKGKTPGGKDAVAWIDTTHGKIMKFDPSQGTTVISDVQQMRTFANDYFTYASLQNTPADNQGIHGTFDDVNSEFIWTVRAWKDVPDWGLDFDIVFITQISPTRLLFTTDPNHNFSPGDTIIIAGVTGFAVNPNGSHVATIAAGNQFEVDFDTMSGGYIGVGGQAGLGVFQQGDVLAFGNGPTTGNTNYHRFPNFYISLIDNNTDTPGTTANWQLIAKDDIGFYNTFTVAYNEVKNKFTTFYSFMPKIYLKRGKIFLSPSPVTPPTGAENLTYEHLRGALCKWYILPTNPNNYLREPWRIGGMCINYDPNLEKRYLAMMLNTEIAPKVIEVRTKENFATMTDLDCVKRGSQYVVAVKDDVSDNSKIFGAWAEVAVQGDAEEYNNLFDFIMKTEVQPRTYKT